MSVTPHIHNSLLLAYPAMTPRSTCLLCLPPLPAPGATSLCADSKWNPQISIVDNIKLPPTLLSRFDLIYLILDKPDRNKDRRLARHMVGLYCADSVAAAAPTDRIVCRCALVVFATVFFFLSLVLRLLLLLKLNGFGFFVCVCCRSVLSVFPLGC